MKNKNLIRETNISFALYLKFIILYIFYVENLMVSSDKYPKISFHGGVQTLC